MAQSQPFISANQVTSLRLLAMPVLAWFVYQPRTPWWGIGIAIGTVIACTDFIDGMLARKYGPTELGGLLDPIADKVFIALTFLPLVDIGYFPAWIVAVMFVREFIVTALRSAYLQRDITFKTSYLSKVKTWVQMQGMGCLMLAGILSRHWMIAILMSTSLAALVPVLVLATRRRRLFRGGVIMFALMGLMTALFAIPDDLTRTIALILYVTTALTWISGLDYLVGGLPRLHRSGGFHRADLVRLFSAMAIPVLSVLALATETLQPFPVLVLFVFELSVGGLDNLLSSHRANTSAGAWCARTLGAGLALLAALLVSSPLVANALAYLAMTISVVGTSLEFWRGREYYLTRAASAT